MIVEPLAPGPFVGCTWGGSRPYGPAIHNGEGRKLLSLCPNEARWLRYDDEHGWMLCDEHIREVAA